MIKSFTISIIAASLLFAAPSTKTQAKDNSVAERGALFYEFNSDNNSTEQQKEDSTASTQNSTPDITKILEELLKVAKEQRDIQKEILEALKEEFNPTPQKVVINGVECIENSSADCFVMPLTKDAKRIPVIKELVTNPTPETAKNYLQWQAKYLNTGPFKVGRSFEYAMNTYGDEAYPINLSRPDANSNTSILSEKKEKARAIILNKMYKEDSLALYIFLQSNALDYFSIKEIAYIVGGIEPKTSVTLIFKSEEDKKNFFEATKGNKYIEKQFKGVKTTINKDSFKVNNIYMTPTYMSAYKKDKTLKKQAVAIGRITKETLNTKIYEWLEQEEILKRGALSDYKVWDVERIEE